MFYFRAINSTQCSKLEKKSRLSGAWILYDLLFDLLQIFYSRGYIFRVFGILSFSVTN